MPFGHRAGPVGGQAGGGQCWSVTGLYVDRAGLSPGCTWHGPFRDVHGPCWSVAGLYVGRASHGAVGGPCGSVMELYMDRATVSPG